MFFKKSNVYFLFFIFYFDFPNIVNTGPTRACVNDVPKIKIGKNQNQNWALIGRGLKPPDYASLFFGNRCQTKEVSENKHWRCSPDRRLSECYTPEVRAQSTAELQQQHVDRLHRHTIYTTSVGMAHANGPTARATVNSTSWWWGQEQRVVLNFVDADTTQKATGATSAQIDFVCVICTSNSSTAAVASLSLPLSLCVSLFKGTSQRYRHLSTCPFVFSQLQRSVCTNGIY